MSYDFAIVGSGFASSLLARILAGAGASVVMLEKSSHPRFALGESSTPLGNLCLERLAARWNLADLHELANHGRWLDSHPNLERGLKRGFTFWFHQPGREFEPGHRNENRLLVAASPEDRLADTHWLRRDVDRYFVERARDAGAELREDTEVVGARQVGDRVELETRGTDGERRLSAGLVIDGSGRAGVVAERFGAKLQKDPARFSSSLVFSHFEGACRLDRAAPGLAPGPYPDEWAAVHHFLEEGWLYALKFDSGLLSAGLVWIDRPGERGAAWAGTTPGEQWRHVLNRYPTLSSQFRSSTPVRPITRVHRMQHRRERPVGSGWVALPHAYAFFEPLFSTGIAWSLVAVERLAEGLTSGGSPTERAEYLTEYGRRLEREADQIERLIFGAYLSRRDPEVFAAQSFLYFASVSFAEARQRLHGSGFDATSGFLGAGETDWEETFDEAVERLQAGDTAGFPKWVESAIRRWNVAGLADAGRHNLYPVDLEVLVQRAELLGLSKREAIRRLPLLRGETVEI